MKKGLFFTVIFCFTIIPGLYPQSIKILEDVAVSAKIELLETWINAQMEYRGLPGLAIGIVYEQELIWKKGFGVRDIDKKLPVETRTIFRIASITKLFTSTAIMQLRDAGKLQLDDPVSDYLKWFKIRDRFPDAPEITIRQLLTHSSGLPRESDFPYWTDHKFPSREQMIEKLPTQETVYPAETKWKYSNLGMAILGEVVAKVSGMSYEDYINQNILGPLQMTSTSVNLSDEHKKRLSVGYRRRQPDGSHDIISFTDSKGLTPAANMSSTVEDMAKFASLQFRYDKSAEEQILKGSTLREMHRVHWLQPGWKSGWGLGFSISKAGDRVLVGHGGWVGGYRTQLLFCVDEKVAVIVMTNTDDGIPYFYAKRAYELVAPAIVKATTPPEPVAEADPAWQNYVGMYRDPWGWDVKIMIMDNKLVMYGYDYPPEDNPIESIIELTPEGEHTFRKTGDNGNGDPVIFEIGTDGEVEQVKTGANYIYPVKKQND